MNCYKTWPFSPSPKHSFIFLWGLQAGFWKERSAKNVWSLPFPITIAVSISAVVAYWFIHMHLLDLKDGLKIKTQSLYCINKHESLETNKKVNSSSSRFFLIELELKTSIRYDKVHNFRLGSFYGCKESMASGNITLGRDANQSLNIFLTAPKNTELDRSRENTGDQ